MEEEKKHGQMGPPTKESTKRARRMDKALSHGQMVQLTLGLSRRTTFMGTESTLGRINASTKEIGC
jgi:hypothetical protein